MSTTRSRYRRPRPTSQSDTPSRPSTWTRVHGTVYGIKCENVRRSWLPWRRRPHIEYVGMYSGDWRERVRQHLYGGGPWHCKPKPWRFLVPGFDENAKTPQQQRLAVDRVIRQGGAVVLWQKRRLRWGKRGPYWKHMRCWYWHVKFRESLAIGSVRPAFNIQENTRNSRHVAKWDQEDMEARWARAAQRRREGAEMGIRRLDDGSWESYGQIPVETGAK